MLNRTGEVVVDDLQFKTYKGTFTNIANEYGQVIAGLLENETLIVDSFLTCSVVADHVASDFVKGIDNEYDTLRGFKITNQSS